MLQMALTKCSFYDSTLRKGGIYGNQCLCYLQQRISSSGSSAQSAYLRSSL